MTAASVDRARPSLEHNASNLLPSLSMLFLTFLGNRPSSGDPQMGPRDTTVGTRPNSERLINNLIQAVPLQAGFLRRVHESLQRRFLGPLKDHRQRAKNRNRRLFRVGSAV